MPYPGVGAPLSAKNTNARVGASILFQTRWDVKPESALLDTSNAEEGGYENQWVGLAKCEISVNGWWNGQSNMHDAPLSIRNGSILQNVYLYVNGLAGPFWHIPYCTVRDTPMQVDVKDLVKYSFNAKVNGAWFYPTGNTSQ